jgi:hypothetical protein
MMARSDVILNELKGMLDVVEKKERIPEALRVDRSANEDQLDKERK